jgi:hypothetical protein
MLIHHGASKAQQTNPALQGKPALRLLGCGLEFASGGKLLSRSACELSPAEASVHTRDNRIPGVQSAAGGEDAGRAAGAAQHDARDVA